MNTATETYTLTIPVPPAGRANPKMMAGSMVASRAPQRTRAGLANLRAVCALVRADQRARDPYTGFTPETTLTEDEAAIVAEAGLEAVAMFETRFDTLRVDFDALAELVRAAWLHAAYLLAVNGYPVHDLSWGRFESAALGELPQLLAQARSPFTERQHRWFIAG